MHLARLVLLPSVAKVELAYLASDAPETTAVRETKPGLSASDIGFAVGVGGGTIADAAQLQHVLSCIVSEGEEPTPDQIGRVVGMLGGTVSEAAVSKR